MRIRNLIGPALCLAMISLSGCGDDAPQPTQPTTTKISGLASKGPIKTGKVKVYAIRNGVEDTSAPIGQALTDDRGNYSVDCGSYKGPVLIEVTGGSFEDEASGDAVTLKAPLRAIISDASTGSKTVAITPLTEMAYKKAKGGGEYTVASIDEANAQISAMFRISDIVATLPVSGGASDDQKTRDEQKKYAAACGSFSQLVNDNRNSGESLDDALARHLSEIGDEVEHNGGISDDTRNRINYAMTGFNNSGRNQTGGTANPIPVPTGGLLKLRTAGASGTIGGIDVTVNLPAGVTVKADANTGETASGAVSISGSAAVGSNKLSSAKFTPASGGNPARLKIILINTSGFGQGGEFVTIRFDLTGESLPAPTAFSVTGFAATDLSASPLSGINAEPLSVAGI